MAIRPNDSPLAGKEGKFLTSGQIKDRLMKEIQTNVSLKISTADGDFEVCGRGELHLGILIETMRREGFEFSIARPRIIFQYVNGKKLEPLEELIIEVEEEFNSVVLEELVENRKSDYHGMITRQGKAILTFHTISRAIIGLKSILDNMTKGTATITSTFHSYVPYKGRLKSSARGAIVSTTTGKATSYALKDIEVRGVMYVAPGTPVYEGLVVGENAKDGDLDVNPCKAKALTNMRSITKEEYYKLAPPKTINLENALALLQDDELIEITPQNIRIRKTELNGSVRRVDRKKLRNEH